MSRFFTLFGSFPGLLILLAAVLCTAQAAAVTVSKVQDLSFGAIVPGSGSGTVKVDTNGVRTSSGAVTVLSQGGTVTHAEFSVADGPAATACDIVLPDNNFVYLTGSGGNTVISNFTSSPAGKIVLNAMGGGTLYVGGTLSVGAYQSPGSYGGSFTVSVTCP